MLDILQQWFKQPTNDPNTTGGTAPYLDNFRQQYVNQYLNQGQGQSGAQSQPAMGQSMPQQGAQPQQQMDINPMAYNPMGQNFRQQLYLQNMQRQQANGYGNYAGTPGQATAPVPPQQQQPQTQQPQTPDMTKERFGLYIDQFLPETQRIAKQLGSKAWGGVDRPSGRDILGLDEYINLMGGDTQGKYRFISDVYNRSKGEGYLPDYVNRMTPLFGELQSQYNQFYP